jgi:hypothetical protein
MHEEPPEFIPSKLVPILSPVEHVGKKQSFILFYRFLGPNAFSWAGTWGIIHIPIAGIKI